MKKQENRQFTMGLRFYRRNVMSSLNLLILQLAKNKSFCAQDIVIFIYEKFGFLISNGSTYPILKSLQKNGLLNRKNKIYSLTKKGDLERRNLIKTYSKVSKEFNTLLKV